MNFFVLMIIVAEFFCVLYWSQPELDPNGNPLPAKTEPWSPLVFWGKAMTALAAVSGITLFLGLIFAMGHGGPSMSHQILIYVSGVMVPLSLVSSFAFYSAAYLRRRRASMGRPH